MGNSDRNRDRVNAQTSTSAFGVGRREGHDSSAFYARFAPPELSDDETVAWTSDLADKLRPGQLVHGAIDELKDLPDNSVALVVTSPPYFVGKEYELAIAGESDDQTSGESHIPETYIEFLAMLRSVFAECRRVLEPGGRIAVNVANLGRKPYRSLSADVTTILQDDLGLLLRGEVIWEKAETSSGSCAWGSFAKASNPVLRDQTERVIIASKGRFSRAIATPKRRKLGLPHESTLSNDEFVDVTRDVWRIDPESATRIGHPAPFPLELPRRLIDLYTFKDDIVVDPFAGSGTTVVAAARTGRIGVGYDTDADYLQVAQQRLEDELEALDRQGHGDRGGGSEGESDRAEVDPVRRYDRYYTAAVNEGRKMHDLAEILLTEAGFEISSNKPKLASGLAEFAYAVTQPSTGRRFWVDTLGGFVTPRAGQPRIEQTWRVLGKLQMLASLGEPDPLLLLVPAAPKPGTPADKALRVVGPARLLDVIAVLDPADRDRLAGYATGADSDPLPGFWP